MRDAITDEDKRDDRLVSININISTRRPINVDALPSCSVGAEARNAPQVRIHCIPLGMGIADVSTSCAPRQSKKRSTMRVCEVEEDVSESRGDASARAPDISDVVGWISETGIVTELPVNSEPCVTTRAPGAGWARATNNTSPPQEKRNRREGQTRGQRRGGNSVCD